MVPPVACSSLDSTVLGLALSDAGQDRAPR